MLFVPLTLVTSPLSALFFVVAVLCLRSLFRDRFGLCALAVGTRVLGKLLFMGCVACAFFSAPPPNPSFQWTAYGSR